MIAILWQNATHIHKLAEMQTNKQALTFIGSQLKMMLVVGSLTLDKTLNSSVLFCICHEKRKPQEKNMVQNTQNIQIYIPFDVGVKLAERFFLRDVENQTEGKMRHKY